MGLVENIKHRATEIGFDLVGIAPLAALRDLEFSRQWVERGYGGEMCYLQNPKRDDPRRVLPSGRSVVCVGIIYNAPLQYSTEIRTAAGSELKAPSSKQNAGGVAQQADPTAWISRYAWGKDYHDLMRDKLEKLRAALEGIAPGVETRVYVDTGPIVERAFARLSGIGWMGKNTCLINEQKGSWFFLGVILTNLELAPDLPAPDRCGSCTRCIEACPTGALVEPYVMDASRCIAYFTIELKGSIPAEFRPAIGANVFGCDICQDVCPWNSKGGGQLPVASGQSQSISAQPSAAGHQARRVATTAGPEFQPLQIECREGLCPPAAAQTAPLPTPGSARTSFSLFNPRLEALASLTEQDFRRIFAHSPIKRAKYRGWLRNLAVVMGNSGDRRFVPWLERVRERADPVLREHAEWALARLSSQ